MSKHLVENLVPVGMIVIFSIAGNVTLAQEGQTDKAAPTAKPTETAPEEPALETTPENTESDWQAAVAKVGEQFKTHYEAGDAKALAAIFTDSGEFIDSERVVYSGREDIEVEFAALFEAIPDRKLELVVDSVRQVADSVVVEDGHAWIQTGESATTTISQYCSLLVRDGEQWKIASLRDVKSEYASASDRLDALDWIIGEWIDESAAGVVEYEFGWSEDNNFILGSYQIRNSEEEGFTGSVRIGWDAANKQFKSWMFDSEGGVSVGLWDPIDEGWIIKNTGTRSDGMVGSSTNYYQLVEDGRVLWKSFDRHVGGEKEPDVEVTLVRKPPVPGGGDDADQAEAEEASDTEVDDQAKEDKSGENQDGNRESGDDKDEKK